MRLHSTLVLAFSLSILPALTVSATAQGKEKLKAALGDVVSAGWIYDDIDKGFAEAKKTGKPLLVAFR